MDRVFNILRLSAWQNAEGHRRIGRGALSPAHCFYADFCVVEGFPSPFHGPSRWVVENGRMTMGRQYVSRHRRRTQDSDCLQDPFRGVVASESSLAKDFLAAGAG